MNTLTTVETEFGFRPTAKLTLRTGREVWVCNPYAEIQDAMAQGKPFGAHAVVGMKPSPIVVNPAHVALVEEDNS